MAMRLRLEKPSGFIFLPPVFGFPFGLPDRMGTYPEPLLNAMGGAPQFRW
jgi:hypothetical protein